MQLPVRLHSCTYTSVTDHRLCCAVKIKSVTARISFMIIGFRSMERGKTKERGTSNLFFFPHPINSDSGSSGEARESAESSAVWRNFSIYSSVQGCGEAVISVRISTKLIKLNNRKDQLLVNVCIFF